MMIGEMLIGEMTGEQFDGFTVDWTKLVLSASKCESRRRSQLKNCLSNGGSVPSLLSTLGGPRNVVYEVLNAMTTFPASNSDETYEALGYPMTEQGPSMAVSIVHTCKTGFR